MADGTDDDKPAGSAGGLQWNKAAGIWTDADGPQESDSRTEPQSWSDRTLPAGPKPDPPARWKGIGAAKLDRALRTDELDSFFSVDSNDRTGDFPQDSLSVPDRRSLPVGPGRGFPDVEAFATFITTATVPPETNYSRNVDDMLSVTPAPRFFADPQGLDILANIKCLNRCHGVADVRVPGTSVSLVNYTYCPGCDRVHSRRDVMDFFSNPNRLDYPMVPRRQQLRGDPRVACKACREMFLPSLLVMDGKPANECPFLGTLQTIDAIEGVYLKRSKRKVLTRNPDNIIYRRGRRRVRNDVLVGDLIDHPTLLANLVLHTPPDLVTSLIEGRNVTNEDPLLGLQF